MCGIAGIVGSADRMALSRMLEAQRHRGPDDDGIFVDEAQGVGLGSVRLSILDLSPLGHMPMSTDDGKVTIVYNGEIYNWREVRQELERLGHRFRSHTDTEVLLCGYCQWGADCLTRLRGMFAFAIWDMRPEQLRQGRGKLFLARDRLGIKPLYWTRRDGVLLFASEIKALIASGLVRRQLDLWAVHDFLAYGSVPFPRTILAEVHTLLPGHHLMLQGGEPVIRQYWDLYEATRVQRQASPTNYPDAVVRLRAMLDEVVKLHMVADVPVGAFLSGGVDSSAIVALMSRQVSIPLRTFSVLFESKRRPAGELHWARMVAERFGTVHQEVFVTQNMVRDSMEAILRAVDQPSIDGINTYFVADATSRSLKVALSGLGADELFAGYGLFDQLEALARIAPRGWSRIGPIVRSWPVRRALGPVQTFVGRCAMSPAERYRSFRRADLTEQMPTVFSPEIAGRLQCLDAAQDEEKLIRSGLDAIAQTTYMEVNGYLRHTLLRDTDAMSMVQSLEVRVPFLDHNVAEYAFSLSPDFKIKGEDRKRILVDAVKDLLPIEIFQRTKEGFTMPWNEWICGPLRPFAAEALQGAESRSVFSESFLSQCLKQLRNDENAGGIWRVVVLLAWMRENHSAI